MKLKIGIVSYNFHASQVYLPALRLCGRAAVTAVSLAKESTSDSAAFDRAEEAVLFDSCEALLEQSDVDAVMIADTGASGLESLAAALDSEKAVFYEPALCCSRQFAVLSDRLLAAEQFTWANLDLSLHPAAARALDMIRSGRIGRLQSMVATLPAVDDASGRIAGNSLLCRYMAVCGRLTGAMPERVLSLDRFPGMIGYYEYQDGSQKLSRLFGAGNSGDGKSSRTEHVLIQDYHGVFGIFKTGSSQEDTAEDNPFPLLLLNGAQGQIRLNFTSGLVSCQCTPGEAPASETHPFLRPYAGLPGVRESVSAFLDRLTPSAGKAPGAGNAEKAALLHRASLAAEESKRTGAWAQVRKLSE